MAARTPLRTPLLCFQTATAKRTMVVIEFHSDRISRATAKKMRISLRAVSTYERSKEIGQPLFYTVFLADGLSITCDPEKIASMSTVISQVGIELGALSKICERAEKGHEVLGVDLGDRKMFVVPETCGEDETRSVTKEMLEYACLEKVSALSFTHFSCYRGPFPKDHCRWLLETMRDYDAAEGPYRLWFEIASEYFAELHDLRNDVFARQKNQIDNKAKCVHP